MTDNAGERRLRRLEGLAARERRARRRPPVRLDPEDEGEPTATDRQDEARFYWEFYGRCLNCGCRTPAHPCPLCGGTV